MKRDTTTESDSSYRPIYNPDLKNANAEAALEHPHPKDMITAMRSHRAKVMRLLDEIGALVGEVQA